MNTTQKLTMSNAKSWTQSRIVFYAKQVEDVLDLPGFAENISFSVDGRGMRALGGLKNGKPFVKMPLKAIKIRIQENITTFKEYSSIEDSPVIGTFDNGSVEDAINCTIVHELAHAVDYWSNRQIELRENVDSNINLYQFPIDRRNNSRGGHGRRWKAIYAKIRQELMKDCAPQKPVAKTTLQPKIATRFTVGESVSFDAGPKLGIRYGKIIKVNPKNLKVREVGYGCWNVPKVIAKKVKKVA